MSLFSRNAIKVVRSLASVPKARVMHARLPALRSFASAPAADSSEIDFHGKSGEELDAIAKGKTRFVRTPLEGAFGTMEAPVNVPSAFESRIVGCLGGEGERKHPLLWFELNRGRKHACTVCGQVFNLGEAEFAE